VKIILFALILVYAANVPSSANNIYVDYNTNDKGDGSKTNPFPFLFQAIEKSRSLENRNKRIHILESGTIYLKDTIRLNEKDSFLEITGTEGTILSGGIKVNGWRKSNDGLWIAKCPTRKAPRELFVNERSLPRARFPNENWLRIQKSLPDKRSGFVFGKNDLPKSLQASKSLELLFLHDWSISRIPIRKIDYDRLILHSKFPIGCSAPHYAIDHFEKNPRYALEGSIELIDQPGEWAYEQGELFYKPLPTQKIHNCNFVIPRLDQLFLIRPTTPDKSISNIKISGLTFSHCRFDLPVEGYASGQATVHEYRDGSEKKGRKIMPAAVRIEGITDSTIDNCKFSNIGGSGLWIGRDCINIKVLNSTFEMIGGNGINLGETDQAAHAKKIEISNSKIQYCGVHFFGSVGIWIGMAENCKVVNCEVSQLPYSGISLGWKWGDEITITKDHQIISNHIHHVMQVLSDGGGIYTLGRQPGTILSNNHIHDIPLNLGKAQSNGIFMDQGSSEITVIENKIHKIAKSPIRFHKAKENFITKNTFRLPKGLDTYTFNSTDKTLIIFTENQVYLD
jgi:hypothetical protein